jgi:hypothetical protein
MTEHSDSQAAQMARLCRQLPEFEAAADLDDWRDVLDAVVADLRAGGSFAEAQARHGLPLLGVSGPDRGAPVDLTPLIDRVPVKGEYRCPLARACTNRGSVHPQSGAEPRCALAGRPMRFALKDA